MIENNRNEGKTNVQTVGREREDHTVGVGGDVRHSERRKNGLTIPEKGREDRLVNASYPAAHTHTRTHTLTLATD